MTLPPGHPLDAPDGVDHDARRRLLDDLRELLLRHFAPDQEHFPFHEPALEALPARLEPGMIARIAARAGRTLLDPAEADDIRATAAFVLGKTAHPAALAVIVRAVTGPAGLPAEARRQCGFAFDSLWPECRPGGPPVDLDAVAAGFKALGVPWDDQARKVAVNDL